MQVKSSLGCGYLWLGDKESWRTGLLRCPLLADVLTERVCTLEKNTELAICGMQPSSALWAGLWLIIQHKLPSHMT